MSSQSVHLTKIFNLLGLKAFNVVLLHETHLKLCHVNFVAF